MPKKYELTNETITIGSIDGYVLHRIRALMSFGDVKTGDLGGFIESEKNLSHDGVCWVYGNAWVYEHAIVYDDAQVYDNAQVYGNAHVYMNAKVYGRAMVCGSAWIKYDAIIFGMIYIDGKARIKKNAYIEKISDYIVIGPIGSRYDHTTFYKTKDGIWVSCGCFNNSIEEFRETVEKVHGGTIYEELYLEACVLAEKSINRG